MTRMRRAVLGIDGNCGYALIGVNLQEGEAEFVEIETEAERGTSEWNRAASIACSKAFLRLKERLAPEIITFALGDTHPRAY